MGAQARHARTVDAAKPALVVPQALAGAMSRIASPVLAIVGPVHQERLGFFGAVRDELRGEADFSAEIVDEQGFPILRVRRQDGLRSLTIECVYWDGAWYFATAFARADRPYAAAEAIRKAMRS